MSVSSAGTSTKKAGISRLFSFPERYPDSFYRGLILVFYLVWFVTALARHVIGETRLMNLLLTAVMAVSIPGMYFASGYYIATRKERGSALKRLLLSWALLYYVAFMFLNTLANFAGRNESLFESLRYSLGLIRYYSEARIFIALALLFLLCAFLWERLELWMKTPWKIILLCVAGFLCVFIPEGILGYGIFGLFVGGDRAAVVPLATHLIPFFWGAYSTTDGKRTIFCRNNLLLCVLFFVCGGAFILLHQTDTAVLLLGFSVSYLLIHCGMVILPIYKKAEDIFLSFCHKLWSSLKRWKTYSSGWKAVSFYIVSYTVLFAVVALLIFFPYITYHRTLIWDADGLGQYVPKIYRFMSLIPGVIRDILHGNLDFKQYDFSTGLGATVAISFEPLYWLYLLFSPGQIEGVYTFMILFRFLLCGLSMSAMVFYFKQSRFAAYTASLVYTFSGYGLYAGTKHGQFIVPMILLPLLVIAMERLIRDKKWFMMTALVGLSLLCSYYFLYINTIALGIYFLARIFFTKEYRNLKTFIGRGLIIVGSYVLGACIGIISLVTSFGSYMGSSRSGSGSISKFLSRSPLYYRGEWPMDSLMSYISVSTTPGLWLKLGFAPIAMLSAILLFTRKNRKELRAVFLIFTLFCFLPIVGYVFSGFSNVNNRWCYIYALIVSFVLAVNLERIPRLTRKEMLFMFGVVSYYGMYVFLSEKYHSDKILGAFGLLAITLVTILLVNNTEVSLSAKTSRRLIFIVTALTLIFNANLFMFSGRVDLGHIKTYTEFGTSKKRITSTPLKYLQDVPGYSDDEFFRSTNLRTKGVNRSASMVLGYNDLSTFSSTLNGGIVNYNRAMGNCDWNIVSIYDYNSRTYMNELASVRYAAVSSNQKTTIPYGYKKVYEKETSGTTHSIYENSYALPLGYTYDNVTPVSVADNYNAVEKQELTMLSAIVEDQDADADSNIGTSDSLPLTAEKLPIKKTIMKGVTQDNSIMVTSAQEGAQEEADQQAKENGDTYIIESTSSSITFTFDGKPNSETYLCLDGDIFKVQDGKEHFINARIVADGMEYLYKFRIDAYTTGQEEFVFNLGYHEKALKGCVMKFNSDSVDESQDYVGILQIKEFSVWSQTMDNYAQRVDALKSESLQNVTAKNNTVTGDITVSQDKMLVITLPFQSGWTAYVDGEETDIQRVNYQYMGINLPAGTHSIRLHYQLPGLKIAFVITLSSLFLFVLLIILYHVRKRRRARS